MKWQSDPSIVGYTVPGIWSGDLRRLTLFRKVTLELELDIEDFCFMFFTAGDMEILFKIILNDKVNRKQ